jgi:galactofuranose transport system permease protein
MQSEVFSRLRPWFQGGSIAWPIIGIVLLLIFNVIYSPTFLHVQVVDGRLYGSLIDILNRGSMVMLLAIGMTLVIALKGVDLSVGSVMAIAGAVAAVLVVQMGWPFELAMLVALGVSIFFGIGNGILVGYIGIQPIIATLILMVAGRGVAMLVTDGQIVTFRDPSFAFFGNGHFLGLPFPVTIVVVTLVVTVVVIRKTAIGLFIESAGGNEKAASACGINARMVKVIVYAFCSLCAGIAGLIATSNILAADSSRVGEWMELDAIFAVVVGGTALTGGKFFIMGSIVGALLIQTLTTTMYNLGVPPAVAPVPKAIVIVGVCLLQSARFRAEVMGLLLRSPSRKPKRAKPAQSKQAPEEGETL